MEDSPKKKNQKLQSFPYDYFKDLNLIKKLGIKKVEWLVDKPRIDNPIFDLEENCDLKNFLKKNKMKINSVILHFLINKNFYYNEKKNSYELLKLMIIKLIKLKINNIILPVNKLDQNLILFLKKFIIPKKNLLSDKINILIEANQDPLKLIDIIKRHKLKNVFLLYDLGNYSEMNRDVIFDIINCHNFIKEFHLKDKYKNKNVFFGKGNVDFKNFLMIYKKLNLKTPLIFENFVGSTPYINTKKQLNYITHL